MDKAYRYKRVKRVVTVLFLLLLLFLFTVPSAYLGRLANELCIEARAADAALRANADPTPHLLRMRSSIDQSCTALGLFLNHSAVDALQAEIHALVPMPRDESLRAALAGVIAAVESLRRIETFEWAEIL